MRARSKVWFPAVVCVVVSGALLVPLYGVALARRKPAATLGPSNPKLWGDRIVYEQVGSYDTDIWVHDLTRPTASKLGWAFGSKMQDGVSINASTVAWIESEGKVRSRDVGKAPWTISSPAAAAQEIARVSGTRYAWVDTNGSPGAIPQVWAATRGGLGVRVSPAAFYQVSPALSGSTLVWEDGRFGDSDIYFKDLASSAAEVNLTRSVAGGGDQMNPAVWATGGSTLVVWQDERSSKGQSEDIYLYDKRTMSNPANAINLTPDPSTTLSQAMAGPTTGGTEDTPGDSFAIVGSVAGFEVGDLARVGSGATEDRMRIVSIDAGARRLNFQTAATDPHPAGESVRVLGRQQRPAIYADAGGYIVVWQDSRKAANPDSSDGPFGIRARLKDGSVRQITPAPSTVNCTRPQVYGNRIVWQQDSGPALTVGMYEFVPFCYDAGAGVNQAGKVPVRGSFAGHDVTFRYGFGRTAGSTDLSGGWSAETSLTAVTLVPSGATPGPGELTVPAASIALSQGTRYYTTAQVNVGGSLSQANSDGVVVDLTAPSVPGALAGSPDDRMVHLSWTASKDTLSGIDYYQVLRWTDAAAAPEVIGEVSEASFLDDGTYGLAGAPVNFTTYHYKVRAVDGAGNVSSESNTIDVMPRPQGRITISAKPARVIYGGRTTLTARLTAGSAAETSRATLWYKNKGTRWVWRSAGPRALLGTTPTATWTRQRPLENTYYEVRWAGSTGFSPATSMTLVRVAPAVSLKITPRVVRRRRRAAFTGKVTPVHKNKIIYLQRYYHRRWILLSRARTSKKSLYRLLWTPKAKGKYTLRVYFPDKDRRHDYGEKRVLVRVR